MVEVFGVEWFARGKVGRKKKWIGGGVGGEGMFLLVIGGLVLSARSAGRGNGGDGLPTLIGCVG